MVHVFMAATNKHIKNLIYNRHRGYYIGVMNSNCLYQSQQYKTVKQYANNFDYYSEQKLRTFLA